MHTSLYRTVLQYVQVEIPGDAAGRFQDKVKEMAEAGSDSDMIIGHLLEVKVSEANCGHKRDYDEIMKRIHNFASSGTMTIFFITVISHDIALRLLPFFPFF